MTELGGIILAGGKSSRMGADKGSLVIGGKKMVDYILNTIRPFTSEKILLITNQPEQYESCAVQIYQDLICDAGPLGGIYTGLRYTSSEYNLVIACDTPLIDPEIIQVLKDHFQPPVSVISYRGLVHPLIGIYSTGIMNDALRAIEGDQLKLIAFIRSVEGAVIPLEKFVTKDKTEALTNVNTRQDLHLLNSYLDQL